MTRKLFRMLFFCVTVIHLFSACQAKDDRNELVICGSYGVPGMFSYDLKGDSYSCNILEEDSFGRILFEYSTVSFVTKQEESVLVICQKYDSDYVYFYEDICYSTEQDPLGIATLKERNDWNAPYNDSKISRRPNQVSFDLNIVIDCPLDNGKVRDACCSFLKVAPAQIIELCFLDHDSDGNVLYWLELEVEEKTEQFYVLINSRYEPQFLEASNNFPLVEDMTTFKAQNNWSFGY